MKRFAIAVGLVFAVATAAAQDASGKWQLTVTTEQRGTQTTSMALKKEGDNLSGTLVGEQDRIHTVVGTQTGANVSLSFSVESENGTLTVSMDGRQDGDIMKGSLRVGTEAVGEWSASRAGAPPAAGTVDLTGTWAFQVETEAGTRNATASVKQDGETLSGQYKSQLGEAILSGQVKGNAFSFQVTLPIEGTPMTIVYSGTADRAGTASGKVSVGDVEVGSFTGKKEASR